VSGAGQSFSTWNHSSSSETVPAGGTTTGSRRRNRLRGTATSAVRSAVPAVAVPQEAACGTANGSSSNSILEGSVTGSPLATSDTPLRWSKRKRVVASLEAVAEGGPEGVEISKQP